MAKVKKILSRVGIALATAGAVLLLFGGGLLLAWRILQSETKGFVQQSIGDSVALLASHVRSDLDPLLQQVEKLGQTQLKSYLNKKDHEPAPAAPEPATAAASSAATSPVAAAPAAHATSTQSASTPESAPAQVVAVSGAAAAASPDLAPTAVIESQSVASAGSSAVPPAAAPAAPSAATPAAPSVLSGSPELRMFEAQGEILDLSLWVRSAAESPPERVHWAKNSAADFGVEAGGSSDELSRKLENEGEAADRDLIRGAFDGNTVVFGQKTVDSRGLLVVALPLGAKGKPSGEVVSAHLRPRTLQAAFQTHAMVTSALVDGSGIFLASGEPGLLFSSQPMHPLVQAFRTGTMKSGQLDFEASDGSRQWGGFHRVGLGTLAVVARIPESEALSGLLAFQSKASLLLGALGIFTFVLAFLWSGRAPRGVRAHERGVERPAPAQDSAAASAPAPHETRSQGSVGMPVPAVTHGTSSGVHAPATETPLAPGESAHAKVSVICVLHGSIRGISGLMDEPEAQGIVDAINDTLTIAATRVRDMGGVFERYAGTSFTATFGAENSAAEADGTEVWKALRCALHLRADFAALNEARKVDGFKTLGFGMGIHGGRALSGRIGAAGSIGFTTIGPVYAVARALDQLSASVGVDLLVSADTWAHSEAHFLGDALGEATLTDESGLVQYYGIWGYRDEQGQEVRVESPYSRTDTRAAAATLEGAVVTAKRWLVNNGSQIVGPFTAPEVAEHLFAQEMDFDSECWQEGKGETSPIRSAGIFTGSEDEGASLWVFDGKTVHGPLSRGFLGTAVTRGAVPLSSYLCEGSTVEGWVPLESWLKEHGDGETPAPRVAESEPVAATAPTSAPAAPAEPAPAAPAPAAPAPASPPVAAEAVPSGAPAFAPPAGEGTSTGLKRSRSSSRIQRPASTGTEADPWSSGTTGGTAGKPGSSEAA